MWHRNVSFHSFLVAILVLAVAVPAFAAPPKKKTSVTKPTGKGKVVSNKQKRVTMATRKIKRVPTYVVYRMTVAQEPMVSDGILPVLTETGEFGNVVVDKASRIRRKGVPVSFASLKPGDELDCYGKWDKDGWQFQATSLNVKSHIADIKLTRKVEVASKETRASRISGGYTVANLGGAAPAPPKTNDIVPEQSKAPEVKPPAQRPASESVPIPGGPSPIGI